MGKLFDFKGTATRKEFIIYFIDIVLLDICIALLGRFLGVKDDYMRAIVFLYWFFVAIPWIAVTFRRLHDIGFSGWFFLLHLIPIVNLFFFLCLVLIPGETENNKYVRKNETENNNNIDNANMAFEQKLIKDYAFYYKTFLSLNEIEAEEKANELLEYAKQTAEEHGTYDLPKNLGDMIVHRELPNHEAAKAIYLKTVERMHRLQLEGVKYKDIKRWWNMSSIERLMIIKLDENIRNNAFVNNQKKIHDLSNEDAAKLAMNEVNKQYARYGYDKATDFTQDDPLPYELKDCVDAYMANASNSETFQEINNFSSFNAFIRQQITDKNL